MTRRRSCRLQIVCTSASASRRWSARPVAGLGGGDGNRTRVQGLADRHRPWRPFAVITRGAFARREQGWAHRTPVRVSQIRPSSSSRLASKCSVVMRRLAVRRASAAVRSDPRGRSRTMAAVAAGPRLSSRSRAASACRAPPIGTTTVCDRHASPFRASGTHRCTVSSSDTATASTSRRRKTPGARRRSRVPPTSGTLTWRSPSMRRRVCPLPSIGKIATAAVP
jgi:hypothetical protein